MAEGYIKLHRNLLENPLASKPDYCWLWCVLLMSASHKETSFVFNNEKHILKAGQLLTGRKKLSKITGISQSQVYKILKYLEMEQQIKQQSNNKFTVITILNWRKYQENGTTEEQEKEQPSNSQVTAKEQPSNTYKNVKNVKNEKNIDIVAVPYSEITKLYNSICKSLPELKVLSDNRKNAIRLRWQKYGKKYGVEIFKELFERAEESDFLSGRNGKWTGCNFDWLLKEANLIKVMEGSYDNR